MDLQFNGKLIVVGGGEGGLGVAICDTLRQEGATVESVDIKTGVDLSDPQAVESYFNKLRKKYGRIDGYCSSVFRSKGNPLLQETPNNFKQVLQDTLYAVVYPVMASVRWMKEARQGRIVIISSTNAFMGYGEGMYDLAKSAINALPTTLLRECARDGISITNLSPDTIGGTPVWDSSQERREALKRVDNLMPDGKTPSATELSLVVAFLFSPPARVFNGNNLIADCGYRYWRPDMTQALEKRGGGV